MLGEGGLKYLGIIFKNNFIKYETNSTTNDTKLEHGKKGPS